MKTKEALTVPPGDGWLYRVLECTQHSHMLSVGVPFMSVVQMGLATIRMDRSYSVE